MDIEKAILKVTIEHFKETAKDRGESIEFSKAAFYKLLDSMESVFAELDNKDKVIELMAEQIAKMTNLVIEPNVTKTDVIQYFENKAKDRG